ncbi:MAG: peptide ABC transporter substrate-binding protein [Chloroflexota bacterium]
MGATRAAENTVAEEEQSVEVTRIVEQVIEVTATPTDAPAKPKDLVICQSQEPDTLYLYGSSMVASRAVQHAIFTNYITNLSYAYQADGLEKLPGLADGDAVINSVEINEGDIVLTADDVVKALEPGDVVINSNMEAVIFDGEPITMGQMVVDFTMLPTVWSDGTPVSASDSIYSFNLASDPNSLTTKRVVERTAGYEATGDLSVRWTGIPGFRDSTYFTNFWQPLPEYILGGYSAAELLEAEESSHMPVGDGPFRITEWIPGDSIHLVRNEYYYRADEGLPYLDSVTFRFIPDTDQLLTQLLSGQCDIGTQDSMGLSEAPFLIEAEAAGILVPYFQSGTVYEHIDFDIDPYGDYADTRYDWFEDVRVRQAMAVCTDRQSMVDAILFGRSEVLYTYAPTNHPLYPAEGVTEWAYDPDSGNTLLDAAGYDQRDNAGFRLDPGGERFAPTLGTTAGDSIREQLTQMFKENMAACGIDVHLYYLPQSEWFADGPDGPLFGRRYDLGEFAWLTGVEPPCDFFLSSQVPGPANAIYEKTGLPYENGWDGRNNSGYSSAEFDTACRTALNSLPGTPTYTENHMEAQRIFAQDMPIIPLFLRLKVAATRPEVINFNIDPTQVSELYNV